MFTNQARRSNRGLNGVCNRCVVGSRGLGAQDDYSSQSQAGMTVQKIASMLAPPLSSIPGYNAVVNVMGKVGFSVNPMSLALATFTGGFSLLPGIGDLFGGLFKKATHFGDCMKWWSDSNIRSMIRGSSPYPFDVTVLFPEASKEYQLEHADTVLSYMPIKNAISISNRQNKIVSIFLSAVRSNPDLMKLHCAVFAQGKGENYGVPISQATVDGYWDQLKEAARQQELQNTVLEIAKLLQPYQAVANQKMAAVTTTRQAGLLPTGTGDKGFQLPAGVVNISKGALVLDVGKDKSTNIVLDYTVGKPTIRKK